jgi:hypothetical protein
MIDLLKAWFWVLFRFIIPDRAVHCVQCGQPLGYVYRFGHRHWQHESCPPYAAVRAVMLAMFVFVFMPIVTLAQTVGDAADELSEATPYENWQILVPILINIAVSTFSKSTWSDQARSLMMIGFSLVVTVVSMFLQGTLDTTPVDLLAELLKVIVATVAFYYGVFKPTGMSKAIHKRTGG